MSLVLSEGPAPCREAAVPGHVPTAELSRIALSAAKLPTHTLHDLARSARLHADSPTPDVVTTGPATSVTGTGHEANTDQPPGAWVEGVHDEAPVSRPRLSSSLGALVGGVLADCPMFGPWHSRGVVSQRDPPPQPPDATSSAMLCGRTWSSERKTGVGGACTVGNCRRPGGYHGCRPDRWNVPGVGWSW